MFFNSLYASSLWKLSFVRALSFVWAPLRAFWLVYQKVWVLTKLLFHSTCSFENKVGYLYIQRDEVLLLSEPSSIYEFSVICFILRALLQTRLDINIFNERKTLFDEPIVRPKADSIRDFDTCELVLQPKPNLV